MEITLHQAADISVVSKYYPPVAASAISYAVSTFLPYAGNFPNSKGRLTPGKNVAEPLHLECFLTIRQSQQESRGTQLLVVLSFTDQYPQQMPSAVLVPPPGGEKIKHPYSVMSNDGRIQVECLSFLRGVERPYPVLDMLLAISEQFELEYPLVSANYRPPAAPTASAVAASTQSAFGNAVSPARQSLVQDAAERVVIDVNEKAGNYLDTREQALLYLQTLNESNRELHKAKKILTTHHNELQEYVPSVGNVNSLLRQLDGHANTVDEHANCLVPADPLQARALELMAEIHASDDTLALLEEGLKRELLTCDEYVKNVSDVGREQFVSRFLYVRVSDRLQKTSGSIGTSSPSTPPASVGSPSSPPEVPQRLAPAEALRMEFPSADMEVIRDVLASVSNDVVVARQQLRMMFP
ncbi:Vps23 core domain containing protein [Novymonas esmeraldas]|uniref:Vps23 core domain containing protein n=1 Tax=Novymonas esmeraldas TaxID=1808958 RepID=A0AAW0EZZ7_9TRYP